jgi:hypothetical protein
MVFERECVIFFIYKPCAVQQDLLRTERKSSLLSSTLPLYYFCCFGKARSANKADFSFIFTEFFKLLIPYVI